MAGIGITKCLGITQQTEEVRKLRDQLAHAHGDLRAATTRTSHTQQTPTNEQSGTVGSR
jgi:hypothetical protein